MSVEVSWYLKGRILYVTGTTDKAEMAERNRRVLELIEAEGEPPMVHNLIDHTNRYSPEDLGRQSRELRYYVDLGDEEIREKLTSHPMLGWVISINTPNAALKMAGVVSSQQRHYRWHSVHSLEEALAFLKERDTSLPADLKAR